MSILLKNNIGLNGTHAETIYMSEDEKYYVPFKYILYKNSDTNIKTNIEYFIKYYPLYNIIIDSRMIKTIAYISNIVDDILIYNINNNEVISLTNFVMDKIGASTILHISECVSILNLFVFINYYCNNKPTWNCDIALKSISSIPFLPNALYIPSICNYINSCNNRNKIIMKANYINIIEQIKVQDNIQPFKANINDILYSLKYLTSQSNYILF